MSKLEVEINPNTELGTIKSDEDLNGALMVQFKAHGMTDEEIEQWFKDAENDNFK